MRGATKPSDKRATARRWFVSGQVQGVGFRYFVDRKANLLGVRGWARNLDDGRVEVYGVADLAALEELAAALHMGPPMAHVTGVEQLEEPVQHFSSFSIR